MVAIPLHLSPFGVVDRGPLGTLLPSSWYAGCNTDALRQWCYRLCVSSYLCIPLLQEKIGWFPMAVEFTVCMHAKSLQLCLTLCNPLDNNPPGSSVHVILQAKILEWVAMPSSRGSSQPKDWACISYVSCTGRWVLYLMCHLGSPAVMLSPFQSNLSQILPSLNCVILFSDLQVALCLTTWSLPTFATLSHIILIPAHFISVNRPPRTSLFFFFNFFLLVGG